MGHFEKHVDQATGIERWVLEDVPVFSAGPAPEGLTPAQVHEWYREEFRRQYRELVEDPEACRRYPKLTESLRAHLGLQPT